MNVVGGSSGHTMITTSSSRSKFKVSWDVRLRWKGKGKKFNILGKEPMETDEKYKTTKGKASFIHPTASF